MQLKAKDIGDDGVDVDLALTPAWLKEQVPDLEAHPAAEGLRFQGRVVPSGQDFLVRGRLRGALLTACGRCLEEARLPVDEEVSVIFVESEAGGDAAAAGDDDESLEAPDVKTFAGGVIDLGEELREEILLALPTQVLCSEACKGLCPVCGSNRNLTSCECEERQRQASSKFASLAKLKD